MGGRSEMLSDTCTTGVSGVGIASSGYAALVSAGSEVLYVSLSSSGKMTSTKLPFPAGYAPGRVTNGINQESDSSAPSEMFLVIADNKNSSAADRIVAYTVSEGMATQCGSIEAGTGTHDVKVDPLDSSRMLVSDSAGISSFTLDGCVMSDYSPVAAVAGGNDGIDTDGTHVYIAAQGSGMRIVDVSLGQLVGKVAIDGWAGGVKVIGSTALVAADPGLIGINIADPTAPKHEWTCHLPSPGLGWNLDVDREACVAFVADNMGGLQVIHMCGDSSQPVEVLARYGNATSPFSAACLAH